MKSPDNQKRLPLELDDQLQDLPAAEVDGLEEVWELSKDAVDLGADQPALDNVWSDINARIDEPAADSSPNLKKMVPVRPMRSSARIVPMRWMAVAATILFGAIGIGYLFKPITVTAPHGETLAVALSDGSTVELNSGSMLSYNRRFTDERRVSLVGEAYFDVAESDIPFVVQTFNASVTVLGTTFNVRAWPGALDHATSVALETGKVSLTSSSTKEALALTPGQTGVVAAEDITLTESDALQISNAMVWRKGGFFYSDELLRTILDDVERRFDTSVVLNPASLASRRMKLAYDEASTSAENIVKDITEILSLKYRATSTGYEIFDPN